MSKLDLCDRLQIIRDSVHIAASEAESLVEDWADYEVLDFVYGERAAAGIMLRKIRQDIDKLIKFRDQIGEERGENGNSIRDISQAVLGTHFDCGRIGIT